MTNTKKIGRNSLCACGSGKKFKHCCSLKTDDNTDQPISPQLQLQLSSQLDTAIEHHNAMRLEAAEYIYQQILQVQPTNADATHLLGLLAHQVGKNEIAIELISKAISNKPNFAEAYNNLGLAKQAIGKTEEARKHFEKAISQNPNLVIAYSNYSNLLYQSDKNYDKAIVFLTKALQIDPDFFMAHFNLGSVLRAQKNYPQAEISFKKALSIEPNSPEAYHELGVAYFMQDQLEAAIDCYKKSIAINPGLAMAHHSLAMATQRAWCIDEAITHYRTAADLTPEDPSIFKEMFLPMQYSGKLNETDLDKALQDFSLRFEAPLTSYWHKHHNSLDPQRKLKLGYVSADLRTHPIANFIEPVLANHNHEEFEIFCYYNNQFEDEVTERFKNMADHWVNCSGISDELMVKRLRDDEIDILIDLSGHTIGNRLLVFARKPVPIQISWMGYVGSTGLSAMDYRFSDAFAEPKDDAFRSIETPLLLNPVWYVYRPCIKNPLLRKSEEMQVRPTPALENGFITLGCLNNISKITPNAIRLWSKILNLLPLSKLILVSKDENNVRTKVLAEFLLHNIEDDRIIFLDYSKDNHYLLYHQIDIALDPYPYNGGTTTCDGVWMGVPFITLSGKAFRSRMGVTIANNIGHPEWVANDEEAYLEKVLSIATDIPKLNIMRLGMRNKVEHSALMDEIGFTRNLESSYRKIWAEYCYTSRKDIEKEVLVA